jgi:TfoX/Sxy family transcriptional regulator of competence genes
MWIELLTRMFQNAMSENGTIDFRRMNGEYGMTMRAIGYNEMVHLSVDPV